MKTKQEIPSNTRFAVAVEGQAMTFWDNIHDAITAAQRAVYAGVDNTTRAIDDLQAGRIAEWGYGFSAVRIYPPIELIKHMTKQEQAMRLYKAVDRLALQAGEDTDEAIDWLCGEHGGMFKLYEAYFSPKPPQRKPLTDEEWQVIADTLDCLITRKQKDIIEAALGIKGEA